MRLLTRQTIRASVKKRLSLRSQIRFDPLPALSRVRFAAGEGANANSSELPYCSAHRSSYLEGTPDELADLFEGLGN